MEILVHGFGEEVNKREVRAGNYSVNHQTWVSRA